MTYGLSERLTPAREREIDRRRAEAEAFWEGAFAGLPAGHALMEAVAMTLALGAPAAYAHPGVGNPTVVLSPAYASVLAGLGAVATPARRRLMRATHRRVLDEARAGGGNAAEAVSRALALPRLPVVRCDGRTTGATMARAMAHEIGHRRTAQALDTGLEGLSLMAARSRDGNGLPPDPWATPLGTRVLAAGTPPSLYAAENPLEWIAEAWVLAHFGRPDAGNAAMVTEIRACVAGADVVGPRRGSHARDRGWRHGTARPAGEAGTAYSPNRASRAAMPSSSGPTR